MATAQATETQISSKGALAVVRNMMRVQLSQIMYARGLLDESSFELVEVCDVQLKSLSASAGCETALKVVNWMESGVFDALNRGFLEKCVLLISRDEQARDICEAWALTVDWQDEIATIRTSRGSSEVLHGGVRASGSSTSSLDVPAAKATKETIKKVSKLMLRQLMSTVQMLDDLPDETWMGFQLLYREDRTPVEYEPDGFHRAVNKDAGSLLFKSRPICLNVGPRLDVKHAGLALQLCLPEESAEGLEPVADCRATKQRPDGTYEFDLTAEVSTPKFVAEELPEQNRDKLLRKAVEYIKRLGPNIEVSAPGLASKLQTTPHHAEEILGYLESPPLSLVSELQAKSRVRITLDPEEQASQTEVMEDQSETDCGQRRPSTPVASGRDGRKRERSDESLARTHHQKPRMSAKADAKPTPRKVSQTNESIRGTR